MSRTGKKPVVLPEKVKAKLNPESLLIEGPLGKKEVPLNSYVKVTLGTNDLVINRVDDSREAKRAHGLVRALTQAAVIGVSKGFEKVLEIEGVGYRAEVKGNDLNLTLGYSHPVAFSIPQGLKVAVEKMTKITLTSFDKALLGQAAANIRDLRPPEPYKGKGIRYQNEVIQRKVGKAAAGGK